MARETLLDFFRDQAARAQPFFIDDDGYRSRTRTYADVSLAARLFAARLQAAGIRPGEKVLIWSENRAEWVAALWGCLLAGVVAVPIDYRTSADFVERVARVVDARVLLTGDEVPGAALSSWPLRELAWTAAATVDETAFPAVARDDLAEILFTSGATAEPKGVLITHRNILANIVPIEGEVRKYFRYAGPFLPIRFLNLLPLSHLFGQSMAAFIPPMVEGIVVFMRGHNPREIVRQVHSRRISVIVSVPKILEVLREHVRREVPEAAHAMTGSPHWLGRWWPYRRVHRLFGWKFWAFVVGAAPLDPELEEFWKRMGYVVIQGYGLTETAPIVTLNHPLHTRKGTVGKPIAGVEIKIAPDGEILVRGENVTRGYYGQSEAGAFEDGWLHTGDVGQLDEGGRLLIRGRKKEMIVTADGRNVFPEDVERVLNAIAGVADSAVVGDDRVHAVLLLKPGARAETVVQQANSQLEDHQKIRGFSIWPGAALPRTEGARKLKRREIGAWVKSGEPAAAAASKADPLTSALQRFAHGREITAETTLDDLGLSSLDRVELMIELEQRLETPLDESRFTSAAKVGDLVAAAPPSEAVEVPGWHRRQPWRALRLAFLNGIVLPLMRVFAWIRVDGREIVDKLEGPVIFAANHQSHFDAPVIMASLPWRYRHSVAPAMSKEYFRDYFHSQDASWGKRFRAALKYHLAVGVFNAFPLPQRETGARQALRLAGDRISGGDSILIFPEGIRTDAGEIRAFQPGVAMMASKLGVPVVPVRLEGVHRVLHQSWRMARPGRVRVTFLDPVTIQGEDYAAAARSLRDKLSPSHDASELS